MSKFAKIAIGAAGGAIGALIMGQAAKATAKVVGAQPPKGEDPTEKVANAVAKKVTGHRLREPARKSGGQVVHYAFGAAMGALYALLAEDVPFVTAGRGALFGAAIYAGAHALAVPAIGLAPGPLESGAKLESAEFSAHLAYGTVTDAVCRLFSR